jgi:hypothetical protein
VKETGSLSIPNPFQRYPIYLTLHKILDGTYRDVPLNDKEVYEELKSIGYAQPKHDDGCWINHSIQEIREMDNQEFYQFLKDYERLLYSLLKPMIKSPI